LEYELKRLALGMQTKEGGLQNWRPSAFRATL
jgi:hypothetical protein